MRQKIECLLFVIGIIMVFTAQANRPDDKGQHAASRPAAPAHNNQPKAPHVQQHAQAPQHAQVPQHTQVSHNQNKPPVQAHREVVRPAAHRAAAPAQGPQMFQSRQNNEASPRVYGIPVPKDARNNNNNSNSNNRLFHHQHHKQWQPLYNFYGNQYHFYPYVNVTSPIELSADYVTVLFNGETYYYDQGSFYVQDPQGYLASPPPIGLIVSALPPNARQITTDSGVYYRYKGIFYVQVAQGYQIVGPVQ